MKKILKFMAVFVIATASACNDDCLYLENTKYYEIPDYLRLNMNRDDTLYFITEDGNADTLAVDDISNSFEYDSFECHNDTVYSYPVNELNQYNIKSNVLSSVIKSVCIQQEYPGVTARFKKVTSSFYEINVEPKTPMFQIKDLVHGDSIYSPTYYGKNDTLEIYLNPTNGIVAYGRPGEPLFHLTEYKRSKNSNNEN